MKAEKKKGLKIFLLFILLLTFLPIIQYLFEPLKLKDLEGAFVVTEKPVLNKKNWEDATFQEHTLLYLTHYTPFRADFVRLKNQLNYWLFDEINTVLTLGKENYIFDPNYIDARTGKDYLAKDIQIKKKNSLIKVKSILDSLNIPLLVCFAPNKANYYPEFLPQTKPLSDKRNQLYFESILGELKIPLINFDRLFISKKTSSAHLLMPKYGAHWSIFGAYIAGTILCNTIDSIKHEKNINIILSSIEKSSKIRFTDDDYLASLNLINKWKSPEMEYPQLTFKVIKQPNVLIISDSFFWNFYDLNLVQNCFSNKSEMWYYNKTRYNNLKEKIGSKTEAITLNQIKHRDIIIIISSDPGLKDFGYGFFEQLSSLYVN